MKKFEMKPIVIVAIGALIVYLTGAATGAMIATIMHSESGAGAMAVQNAPSPSVENPNLRPFGMQEGDNIGRQSELNFYKGNPLTIVRDGVVQKNADTDAFYGIESVQNAAFNLKGIKSDYTLLMFGAPTCGGCEPIPYFFSWLSDKYGDRLTCIAAYPGSRNKEEADEILKYIKNEFSKQVHGGHKLPARNVIYAVCGQNAEEFGLMFGVQYTPTLFLIDRAGKILYKGTIDDNLDIFEYMVEQKLVELNPEEKIRDNKSGDKSVRKDRLVKLLDKLLGGNKEGAAE